MRKVHTFQEVCAKRNRSGTLCNFSVIGNASARLLVPFVTSQKLCKTAMETRFIRFYRSHDESRGVKEENERYFLMLQDIKQ